MKKILALALLLFAGTVSAQAQTWTEGQGCIAVSEVTWSDGSVGDAYVGFARDANGVGQGYMLGVTNRNWKIGRDFEEKGFAKFVPSGTSLPINIKGLAPQGGSDPMLIFQIPLTRDSFSLMTESSQVVMTNLKGDGRMPLELIDITQALTVIYLCERAR